MNAMPLPLTSLIHDSLATVMCFCLSREKTNRVLEHTFQGEWKYLRKVVLERAEQQATKAMLELALFLRILDDNEGFSKREWKEMDCGRLFERDGAISDVSPRQIANKIIHAESYSWKEEDPNGFMLGPILICHGRSNEKWEKAEIEIYAVAALCGQLMS
jgi:hypothetical protein